MFGRKQKEDYEVRGGCSVHDMRGPVRTTSKAAHKDVYQHGERIHGSRVFRGGYIERVR